jgi:hypothetical protein
MKGTRCSPLWSLPSSLLFLSASGSYFAPPKRMTLTSFLEDPGLNSGLPRRALLDSFEQACDQG